MKVLNNLIETVVSAKEKTTSKKGIVHILAQKKVTKLGKNQLNEKRKKMGILTKVRWLPGQVVPNFVYRPVPPQKFEWKGKQGYGSMQVMTLAQRSTLNKLYSNGEIWFVSDGESDGKGSGPTEVE